MNTCIDPNKDCNCDSSISGWKHDEGVLTSPDDVGITRMFFFQLPNATRDSQADLVLGNLSCIDTGRTMRSRRQLTNVMMLG